jgi:hypothetical protein
MPATAEPVALVLMERLYFLMAESAESAELEGAEATVVWVWRGVVALVAVAVLVALGSMRAASTTVRLVVMAERVALVDRAVQLARLVRTPQR